MVIDTICETVLVLVMKMVAWTIHTSSSLILNLKSKHFELVHGTSWVVILNDMFDHHPMVALWQQLAVDFSKDWRLKLFSLGADFLNSRNTLMHWAHLFSQASEILTLSLTLLSLDWSFWRSSQTLLQEMSPNNNICCQNLNSRWSYLT